MLAAAGLCHGAPGTGLSNKAPTVVAVVLTLLCKAGQGLLAQREGLEHRDPSQGGTGSGTLVGEGQGWLMLPVMLGLCSWFLGWEPGGL